MKYQLSVRELAERDMEEAYDFYEGEQPGVGVRFHDEVAATLRKIEENPMMYPPAKVSRYRKAVVNVFPFCIYYYVVGVKIVVVAVHDSRRDPRIWQSR